jgi:hypothetical protein
MQLLITQRGDPVHVVDGVGIEQAVESSGRKRERPSNAGSQQDPT